MSVLPSGSPPCMGQPHCAARLTPPVGGRTSLLPRYRSAVTVHEPRGLVHAIDGGRTRALPNRAYWGMLAWAIGSHLLERSLSCTQGQGMPHGARDAVAG